MESRITDSPPGLPQSSTRTCRPLPDRPGEAGSGGPSSTPIAAWETLGPIAACELPFDVLIMLASIYTMIRLASCIRAAQQSATSPGSVGAPGCG